MLLDMPELFYRVAEGPKSKHDLYTKLGNKTSAVFASLIHTTRFEQLNHILELKCLNDMIGDSQRTSISFATDSRTKLFTHNNLR